MKKNKLITLDNGLKVFIYQNNTKPIKIVRFFTLFGGNSFKLEDGTNIIPGTAHLLEHYICENNKHGILNIELLKNKAYKANARTGYDATYFYFDALENFDKLFNILLDSVYNITFTKKRLIETKKDIYNEIRDLKDEIGEKIFNNKIKGLFKEYHDIIGTKSDVDKIDYKYLKYIYKNVYVPKNQFLVIGGDVDSDDIIKKLNDFYNKNKFNEGLKPLSYHEKDIIYKKEINVSDNIDDIYISFKFDIDNYNNYDLYKLDFYLHYFIDIFLSADSIINEELKYNKIIIGDINSEIYLQNHCYIIEISALPNDKKKFTKMILNYINNLEFKEEDFNLQILRTKANISIREDYVSSYLDYNQNNYLKFNYFDIDTLDRIDNFKFDDFVKTIKSLNFNNYSITYVNKK